MIFGRLPLPEADGAILAHAVDAGRLGLLKKGHILNQDTLVAIKSTGADTVLVAKLEAGDVGEDTAAGDIAAPLAGANISVKRAFTGRSNLHSQSSGLARINKDLLDKINKIDPSITVATVKNFEKIDVNQMVATVKIIPFATHETNVSDALDYALNAKTPLVEVAPFTSKKIGVISTRLPKTTDKLIAKSEKVLANRIEACDNHISVTKTVEHHEDRLTGVIDDLVADGCELILIFGASATTDHRDVVPRAIEISGGKVDHFGMPVDPGNLLLLGKVGSTTVVGLPGCTRSPKLNGFDWILQRLLCDIPVEPEHIMEMGEGGLLKEITSRPQPREFKLAKDAKTEDKKIAVLLLAAGQSRRMGAQNKLLALVHDKPMIRHAVEQAKASKADHVLMVTGHEPEQVLNTVWDLDVPSVQNDLYGDGISTSVKLGFSILSKDFDGIIVCLGDMPLVTAEILDELINAFDPDAGRAIVVPAFKGKRGNPAIISSQFAGDITEITGDMGAKALISNNDHVVHTVEIDSSSIFADIDTPDILATINKQLSKKSD
ncbi:MAG: molybdopterin-binding/glycosyltransferase family 2 protein [Sneathiella sp.]